MDAEAGAFVRIASRQLEVQERFVYILDQLQAMRRDESVKMELAPPGSLLAMQKARAWRPVPGPGQAKAPAHHAAVAKKPPRRAAPAAPLADSPTNPKQGVAEPSAGPGGAPSAMPVVAAYAAPAPVPPPAAACAASAWPSPLRRRCCCCDCCCCCCCDCCCWCNCCCCCIICCPPPRPCCPTINETCC